MGGRDEECWVGRWVISGDSIGKFVLGPVVVSILVLWGGGVIVRWVVTIGRMDFVLIVVEFGWDGGVWFELGVVVWVVTVSRVDFILSVSPI